MGISKEAQENKPKKPQNGYFAFKAIKQKEWKDDPSSKPDFDGVPAKHLSKLWNDMSEAEKKKFDPTEEAM